MRLWPRGFSMDDFVIETPRLLLRGWTQADAAPFQQICSDPQVMEYLGEPMTLAETEMVVTRMQAMQEQLGYCFWAMEHRETGALMGFCGVKPGAIGTSIDGQLEIGWRMARAYWGKGYAREAAQAAINWVWINLKVDSVWAITAPANERSQALMRRLGMTRHRKLDFQHPAMPPGDPLRAHVTYSLPRPKDIPAP